MIAFFILLFALYSFFTKRKGISLFLLAALVTGGFWIIGVNTKMFGFSLQLTDFALVYVFIILFYKISRGKLKKLPLQFKGIRYFWFFLLVAYFVDYVINGTSLLDIFSTSRHWYFLLFIYLLPSFHSKDILHAFKLIIVTAIIELVLFLTEPLTGIVLFSYEGTIEALKLTNVSRFALLPPLTFLLFVWVFSSKNINAVYKYVLLALIILAVLITATRSSLIALLMIIVLSIFIIKKQSLTKKIGVLLSIIFIIVSISFYQPFYSRFEGSIEDFNSVNKLNSDVEGNISYRILFFAERFNYILKKPETALFGIGFISEKKFSGHKFNIGIIDENNQISQLDTGDIAWALFALRLGIIGTLCYLLIYFNLLKCFWENRDNFYAITGLYYIVLFLILSSSGVDFYRGTFILIPALLFQLIKYSKKINY